jgi:GT2 family glycosyltransferase
VVTHDGERWLDACLRSLAAQTYPWVDVIVVDNASPVPAERILWSVLPAAESVRLETNVGFGAAANQALELSRRAPRADYFLFIHDDVALEPECVERLVGTALETDAGIVGGKGLAWERPEVLLEVGMSADAFCYPFSGLEDGEIDQGQHDLRGEVLFVTSACMLVGRTAMAKCGSWDGDYFLFTEDLDLCMRARLSGFKVVVQPAARFRHVQALVRRRRPGLGVSDIRFLTRRNRTRTIVKNASLPRVVPLLALFTLFAFAEMMLLALMRRFDEVPAYPRAFGSFLATLPHLLRARAAVQKRRTVSDRRMRRLMIRAIPRTRIFLERQLREWERGTVSFGTRTMSNLTPSALAQRISEFARRPATVAAGATVAVLLLAMRRTVFGGTVAAGSLWPFPAEVHRLLSDYLAPWRDIGLGTSASAPAAFPLLWLFGALGLGSPRAAQLLLELGLAVAGISGLAVLVGRRTRDVPARVVAITFYALAPPVRQAVETADLAALALYAGLPWILDIVLRMVAPTPGDRVERPATRLVPAAMVPAVARAGIVSALVVALAPTAWPVLALAWLVLGLAASVGSPLPGEGGRRLGRALASVALVPVLLVPWSFEAFRPNGSVFAALLGGRGPDGAFGALWARTSFTQGLFLGSGVSWLVRPACLAAALGALLLTTPARRRESRLLVVVWLVFSAIGGLAGAGWVPAPASTPALWMILPLVVVAVLASHLLAGLRHELPRHAIGWRHLATPVLVVVTIAGVVAIWGQAAGGWRRPASTAAADAEGSGNSLTSFFASTAREVGSFRVLWLGHAWTSPVQAGAARRGGTPYLLTGPGGLTMRDAFPPPPSGGERHLEDALSVMSDRTAHLSGHLLGPAGIRYVVADRRDPAALAAVDRQRDFVLDQQFDDAAVFQNVQWLPRASFGTPELTAAASAPPDLDDLDSQMRAVWGPGPALEGRSPLRFEGPVPKQATSVLLGDTFSPHWKLHAGGRSLGPTRAFGWSTLFTLPPEAAGTAGGVRVGYTSRWLHLAGLGVQALLLAMTLAVARGSRRSEPAGRHSTSPEPVSHETDVPHRARAHAGRRPTTERTRASR